jgi:hypothetical protein
MMVYGILSAVFPSEFIRMVGRYIAPINLLAALFHIGIIIPNKNVKKRYFTYVGIIIGETLMFILLSLILNVSLTNTLLAKISVIIIMLTISIIILDIGRYIKDTKPNIAMILYFIFFVGIIIVAGQVLIMVINL